MSDILIRARKWLEQEVTQPQWKKSILCEALMNVFFFPWRYLCSFSSCKQNERGFRKVRVGPCNLLATHAYGGLLVLDFFLWKRREAETKLGLVAVDKFGSSFSSSHQTEARWVGCMSYLRGRSHREGMARSQQCFSSSCLPASFFHPLHSSCPNTLNA